MTDTSIDWDKLAKQLGTSVDGAHQAAEKYESEVNSAGINMSLSQVAATMSNDAGVAPSQASLREGAEQFYGYSAEQWQKLSPKQKADQIKSYVVSPDSAPDFSPGTVKQVDAAAADPKSAKSASSAKDQAKETKQIESEIAGGPWSKLSEGVIKEYESALTPTIAAVSGSTGPAAENSAVNQALAEVGTSSIGGAGQGWLQSQVNAGTAGAAPVTAAEQAYGKQYAASAGPITKALAAYGQANELEVSTAPESAWLTALASHITSNLSYYGEIPTASVGSIPAGVVEALEQSGGYGGSTQGLEPLTDLQVKGGQVTIPKGASAATASSALAQGGTIPSAGVSAGS